MQGKQGMWLMQRDLPETKRSGFQGKARYHGGMCLGMRREWCVAKLLPPQEVMLADVFIPWPGTCHKCAVHAISRTDTGFDAHFSLGLHNWHSLFAHVRCYPGLILTCNL